MVKKITKYAKFMVCCALIMSLIAPSYAALSASDGSAFVTKAEFDSALADFNARLTTFEAGINSKIDSQVTSYLDRNGIWNGKDQTINDGARWGYRWDYDNFFNRITGGKTHYGTSGSATIYATLTPKAYVNLGEKYSVIDQVDKSGLLCLKTSSSLASFSYTSDSDYNENPVAKWKQDIFTDHNSTMDLSSISWSTGGGIEGFWRGQPATGASKYNVTVSTFLHYESEKDGTYLIKQIATGSHDQDTGSQSASATEVRTWATMFTFPSWAMWTGYDYFFVTKGANIQVFPRVTTLGNTVLSTDYTTFVGNSKNPNSYQSVPTNTCFTVLSMVLSAVVY